MGVYYYMECITELANGYSCGLELLMGYGGDLTFNGDITTKKWNIMGIWIAKPTIMPQGGLTTWIYSDQW